MPAELQIGSHVTPITENVVGRTQDYGFHYFHPRQRLEVISLGCGLAICRPEDGGATELFSIQTADLELW